MLLMNGISRFTFFFMLAGLHTCFFSVRASAEPIDVATQEALDFDYFDDEQDSAELESEITDQEALDFLGLDEQDEESDLTDKYKPAVFNSRTQHKTRDIAFTIAGATAAIVALINYTSSRYKIPFAMLGGAGVICSLAGSFQLAIVDYSQAPVVTISRDGIDFHRLDRWYAWDQINIEILKKTEGGNHNISIPLFHSDSRISLWWKLIKPCG